VDYLARNGFVVLKIDMRGHGKSEGVATGTYFSNAYNLDVLNALQALKNDKRVNPERIGLWGHSMSGNLVLRSLLISNEFKAGVIWAGAVYSYQDFAKYGISDSSFVRRPAMSKEVLESPDREKSPEVSKIRENPSEINFESEFWREISLTKNLEYLKAPIQIHHAVNDETVNIGYSRDLSRELEKSGKSFEFYEYPGGGHNLNSPYFEQAMQRTVEFFRNNLKTE
jgi:dipeptidyl aminopeptidase/acylaminoacyl peptidase